MRLRMTKGTVAVASVTILLIAFTAVAVAHHDLEYVDDQTSSSGNWIWWRTGFDWSHDDDFHFKGYAASGGSPSGGGTFDGLSIYTWAGASCDNGLTWPYSSSNNTSLSHSTLISIGTSQVTIPSCSSSPKYRSSSSHVWEDGAWLIGKIQAWSQ